MVADRGRPLLACDSMLGGLARWLRAAGHDASWHEGIDDGELVRLCRDQGRTVLSSDDDIFGFALVRDGVVPSLFVPRGRPVHEQLAFVLRELKLPRLEPRCMACGGELAEVPRDEARERVPPRSFAWVEQFFACRDCGQMFWHGSHWQRIVSTLERVRGGEVR